MAKNPNNLDCLIARLQAYRQHARNNTLENIPTRDYKKRKVYPPIVLAKRNEILANLLIKHREKIKAKPMVNGKGGLYGILCATATRMALDQLGINNSGRKGFHRMRAMN